MAVDRLYFNALEATRDGLVITEYTGGQNLISYVNPAFEVLTGYCAEECLGRNCNFLQREDVNQPEIEQIREAIKLGQPILTTLKNYKKDGTLFWNELSISPIQDDSGEITHFVGIQKDVTEQVNLQKQLNLTNIKLQEANRHLANDNKIDQLTGLYNRKVIDQDVQTFISIARRQKSALAFYFIDIDNFKSINDQYGHDVGDLCIQYVSEQLLNVFKRLQDLVIRYGGEEFLVVSYGGYEQGLDCLATDVLQVIREGEVVIPNRNLTLKLTVSIGVASSLVLDDFNLQETIQNADSAMYQAKKKGKNQIVYSS